MTFCNLRSLLCLGQSALANRPTVFLQLLCSNNLAVLVYVDAAANMALRTASPTRIGVGRGRYAGCTDSGKLNNVGRSIRGAIAPGSAAVRVSPAPAVAAAAAAESCTCLARSPPAAWKPPLGTIVVLSIAVVGSALGGRRCLPLLLRLIGLTDGLIDGFGRE